MMATALEDAIRLADADRILTLLADGLSVEGDSAAVSQAAGLGFSTIVQLLCEHKASVNVTNTTDPHPHFAQPQAPDT